MFAVDVHGQEIYSDVLLCCAAGRNPRKLLWASLSLQFCEDFRRERTPDRPETWMCYR